MIYEIRFRPMAIADLSELYEWITEQGGKRTAEAYLDRIEAACFSLSTFPERGTRRDDLSPGIRVMGFERRALIAFRVVGGVVTIIRIFYGGQDYERAQSLTANDE
jgi:toxin ParE1/3/4